MSMEDQAHEREVAEWAARNAPRTPRPTFEPGQKGYGPKYCEECESEMPELRRANGWRLCTGCQSAVERGRIRR